MTATRRAKYRMRRDHEGALHRVVTLNGVDGFEVTYSTHCTGCTETPEFTSAPERGMGCHECGHTGRRRRHDWAPFDFADYDRAARALDAHRDRAK